jgi:hypothetical protein
MSEAHEAYATPGTRTADSTQGAYEPHAAGAGPDPVVTPGDPVADSGPVQPGGAPEPLGVVIEPTGNAEVDAAVERLGDADALPTEGHIEVYEDVHTGLRDALAALDENRG